jgi:hypothetical protein
VTVFLRLIGVPVADKADALLSSIRNSESDSRFELSTVEFGRVPGSPFAYWVSRGIRDTFQRLKPFQGSGKSAVSGGKTLDDFRFLRSWWEVRASKDWPAFAKGGAFSPFYADVSLVLGWKDEASALKAYVEEYRGSRGWSAKWTAVLNGIDHYFRPGLTWPRRTNGLSFRVMPRGCIFADKGPAAFCEGDDPQDILSLCALMNSNAFGYLVSVQLARTELAQSFEVGLIQQTPVPMLAAENRELGAGLARSLWSAKRSLDSSNELSHAFLLPGPVRQRVSSFDAQEVETRADSLARQIEDWALCLYDFEAEDRAAIGTLAKGTEGDEVPDDGLNTLGIDEIDTADDEGSSLGLLETVCSWSVGVAFGRFDIRIATGERAIPPEPDPFDPLPAKSPGMLPDGDAPFLPTTGVFVDDPGHADDLAARVTAVYERVGEAPPAPAELRKTLAKDFFPAHIRLYSKSRRKAPIYWQLATPSASYSAWLYIHAFGKDTLFRVQNDYVAPKLAHERRELEGLLAEAGPSPTTAQSRAIETQAAFVEELSALLDEVRRVAPLWDPDLDDGVILNFAPLWRLVPQNRAWQKELRAEWASLVAGDYDWAHLSMRLWPERVVPKCVTDRSLAIAHDLEDVFWFEDPTGKWQARPTPVRAIDDLIAERTSPAVKAALQSLLDAPEPVAASGRGRRKKS